MKRLLLPLVLALCTGSDLVACPIVTGILTRPGASAESFAGKVLEISRQTQELFESPDFDRTRAMEGTSRALDIWLDLYLHYYLAPPEDFRDNPHWRLVMDSITGPLRRLQTYARQGDYPRGHAQLRVLQDMLTEFYGEPPQRTAAGFGPVFHSLETMRAIPAGGGVLDKERRARMTLLRVRFEDWFARWKGRDKLPEAFHSFRERLGRLEEAVERSQGKSVETLLEELLGSSKEMIREGLALEWATATP